MEGVDLLSPGCRAPLFGARDPPAKRAGLSAVTTEPDVATAARALQRDLNEPATVVVTGSFMHLTAVREVLQGG